MKKNNKERKWVSKAKNLIHQSVNSFCKAKQDDTLRSTVLSYSCL
jgi:hypothetical protein